MDTDFPPPSDPRPPTPAECVWSEFQAVLEALSPRARDVFILHVVSGATLRDVSIALGMPLAECREQVALARRCAREHARRLDTSARPP